MRLFTLLILISSIAKSQCPNVDSLIKVRGPINYPVIWEPSPPIGWWPGPLTVSSCTWAFSTYKPTLNEEPECGKKIYFKNGWCYIYYPDAAAILAKGKVINKKKTGKWYWYTYEQTLQATGEYVDGLKQGTWKIFNGEESYSIGKYVNGYREGNWKTINSLHTLQSKSFYKKGYIEGKSINYRYDGKLESINIYSNEMKNTQTFIYDEKGRLTEKSQTYNWKLYGERIFIEHDAGRKTIEHYSNGELNGWKYIYQYNQLISKEYYKKGMKNGLSTVIDYNDKYIRNYKNDLINGSCIMYTKVNGNWVLRNKSTFINNILEGPGISKLNDSLTMYTNHKNGVLEGLHFTLLHNKDTVGVCNYVDGKKHGREMEIKNNQVIESYYDMNNFTERKIKANGKITEHCRYFSNQPIDMLVAVADKNNYLTYKLYYPDSSIRTIRTVRTNAKFNDTIVGYEYFDNGKLYKQYTLVNYQFENIFVELTSLGDTLQYFHKTKGVNNGYSVAFVNYFTEKGNYVDGKKTGEWKYYYSTLSKHAANTLAAKGNMIKGEPFETWQTFDVNGNLIYEGCQCGLNYNYVVREIPQLFLHKNYVSYDNILDIGISCGNRTWYYTNGKPMEKFSAPKGSNRERNIYTSYYESGQMQDLGTFLNNLKHGTWKKFDINGNVIEEKQFIGGMEQRL